MNNVLLYLDSVSRLIFSIPTISWSYPAAGSGKTFPSTTCIVFVHSHCLYIWPLDRSPVYHSANTCRQADTFSHTAQWSKHTHHSEYILFCQVSGFACISIQLGRVNSMKQFHLLTLNFCSPGVLEELCLTVMHCIG